MSKRKVDSKAVEKSAGTPTVVSEHVKVYQQQQKSVETMITQAIKSGVPVETMERVLEMRTKLKTEYAKEQYDRAMAAFQAECPVIKRVKTGSKTKAGEVVFKYAPLEHIIAQVKGLLAKNGLSYNFKPVKNDQGVVTDVRCYAIHVEGHSDFSEMPVEKSAGTSVMSNSQIGAASITFAKRYAFTNMFGIVTEEEDNEDNLPRDTEVQTSAPTVGTLRGMIKDANLTEKNVASKFKVESIDQLDARSKKILEKSLLEKLGKDYIPTIVQV